MHTHRLPIPWKETRNDFKKNYNNSGNSASYSCISLEKELLRSGKLPSHIAATHISRINHYRSDLILTTKRQKTGSTTLFEGNRWSWARTYHKLILFDSPRKVEEQNKSKKKKMVANNRLTLVQFSQREEIRWRFYFSNNVFERLHILMDYYLVENNLPVCINWLFSTLPWVKNRRQTYLTFSTFDILKFDLCSNNFDEK